MSLSVQISRAIVSSVAYGMAIYLFVPAVAAIIVHAFSIRTKVRPPGQGGIAFMLVASGMLIGFATLFLRATQ